MLFEGARARERSSIAHVPEEEKAPLRHLHDVHRLPPLAVVLDHIAADYALYRFEHGSIVGILRMYAFVIR